MTIKEATQYPTSWRLVLGILCAISTFAAAAYAQPSFAGKFTLPYEVHWGQSVPPAGDYTIRMGPTGPAVIRSADGARALFTRIPAVAEMRNHESRVDAAASCHSRRPGIRGNAYSGFSRNGFQRLGFFHGLVMLVAFFLAAWPNVKAA